MSPEVTGADDDIVFGTHDKLTRLRNLNGFEPKLTQWSEAAEAGLIDPFILMYLDLDGLKDVNRMYLHAGGNNLLEATADAIKLSVGPYGVPSRLHGDEYALLATLSEIPDDQMDNPPSLHMRFESTVTNLQLRIEDTFFTEVGQKLGVPIKMLQNMGIGISSGAALWRPGISTSELLDEADVAQAHAKEVRKAAFVASLPPEKCNMLLTAAKFMIMGKLLGDQALGGRDITRFVS
jgi:diguanylate cyclase (GGDEF)-like protein